MRTTLDIEDDVLAAAKELARRQGTSAGRMISRLLRQAMAGPVATGPAEGASEAVFRPFEVTEPRLVTDDLIDQLRDQDGL